MSLPPTAGRPSATRGGAGRAFEIGVATYGIVIFTTLWVGFAIGVATGGDLLADAWAWLSGLEPLAAIVAWVLLLPIAVGLWAWSSDLPPIAVAAVGIGLVAWTLLAASGARRALRGRTTPTRAGR